MKKIRLSQGFTLIELSIVLVIIGLIAGGVMVGQGLIKAAELKNIISDIEMFKTTAMAFKLKYGYLPGDLPNQASFFDDAECVAKPTKCAGNGDSMVQYNGSLAACKEERLIWHNLVWAGLLNRSMSTWDVSCNNAINAAASPMVGNDAELRAGILSPQYNPGSWWAGYATGGSHSIVLGTGASLYTGIVPTADAHAIDVKLDDGIARGGKIHGEVTITGNPDLRNCRNGTLYNVAYTEKMDSCLMRFPMPF